MGSPSSYPVCPSILSTDRRTERNPLMQATAARALIYTPLEEKREKGKIKSPKIKFSQPHRVQCRWALGINDRRTQHGPLLFVDAGVIP